MDENMNPAQAWREAAPPNHFNVAFSSGSTFADIWQTHAGGIGADLSGVQTSMQSLTGLIYPLPEEDDLVGTWIASGT